jgi:hypothetical protein
MGESSEEIAANGCGNENNGIGSQAHHVGISTTEDRVGTKGTVGEDTSAGEEGGLVAWEACCGDFAADFRVWVPG